MDILSLTPQPNELKFETLKPELNNIWDINPSLKCPVIGSCLSIDEHRKILKRAGVNVKRKRPYELHKDIMEHLGYSNKVSDKVNSLLKHKYRDETEKMIKMDESELRCLWETELKTGNIGHVLYHISSRSKLSDDFLSEVFGEAHMLSHTNTINVMETKQDLQKYIDKSVRLEEQLKAEKEKGKVVKKELKLLEKSVAEKAELLDKALQNPIRKILKSSREDELAKENQLLKEKIRELEGENYNISGELRRTEREKRSLQIKSFELENGSQELSAELNQLIEYVTSFVNCKENNCDESCPEFNLCAKRILVVGGITKMKHHYRNLIESSGGLFDYHDGYMKNGNHNLEARVKRSDLVICPVNCNSHNACLKVKQLCNKHNKDIKMLNSSSISAFSSALYEPSSLHQIN
jgi:hypothetical protein